MYDAWRLQKKKKSKTAELNSVPEQHQWKCCAQNCSLPQTLAGRHVVSQSSWLLSLSLFKYPDYRDVIWKILYVMWSIVLCDTACTGHLLWDFDRHFHLKCYHSCYNEYITTDNVALLSSLLLTYFTLFSLTNADWIWSDLYCWYNQKPTDSIIVTIIVNGKSLLDEAIFWGLF